LAIAGTGTVQLAADNTYAAGTTIESGTLDLAHVGAAGLNDIVFKAGANATLLFALADAPANTIDSFAAGDTIDVTGLLATTHGYGDGRLVFGAATLEIAGGFTTGSFSVTDDTGDDETIVTVSCFAAGTRLATPQGEAVVASLRVGDLVTTQSGGPRPVRWLGHRHVDCRRHARPQDVWPVRVAAGAFGPGLPCRDLVLSPDHAVHVDGVLIPVRCLINGAGIAQEPWASVTYWHVELDRHDVLLAEALPCESFLDTGNRAAFANGGVVMQMHPDFARHMWEGAACAPLVVAGPQLDRVRARLRAPATQTRTFG
jgi:autotransporter-associated beta strand protein